MKKIVFLLVAFLSINSAFAKDNEIEDIKYRRSSVYSILVSHSEQKFAEEIREQFLAVPIPDKYNDHDLSVKVVKVSKNAEYSDSIEKFINDNHIGSRLVAKWFNRSILTGECSMDLVQTRGLYDASELDREFAARSARGMAMLEDAGEELIGNTFLLVNEINYIDKAKRSQNVAAGIKAFGSLFSAFSGVDITDFTDLSGNMVETIKGFRVKIKTRLYQLVWDDETANTFYKFYYTEKPDTKKMTDFERNRDIFKMRYVGVVESKGSTTSFMGINEEEPLLMIRKACQRAIDENIADLQKKHEPFRIKSPIIGIEPEIKVQIGLKEGITKDSKFEVLEAVEKNGKIKYQRVGVIKPVATKIWDNRFMAAEEGAYGADFKATSFIKVSGGDFYPGLLVRQIE